MARNGRKLAKRKSCQFFKSPVFILIELWSDKQLNSAIAKMNDDKLSQKLFKM